MPNGAVPQRGDVVWVPLDLQAGHEQAGRRPAVVLSPQAYNRRVGLALLCPITSKAKGYPIGGVVLADQVKSLDWRARKCKRIQSLPGGFMNEVLQKTGALIT